MKRITYRRFVMLAAASVLCFSFVTGCNQQNPSSAENSPDNSSETQTTNKDNWPKYMGLAAGGSSSQTGIVGAVMAPALTDYLGISVSSETSGGMTANLLMVNDGTADIGITGTDFAYEAWNGEADWAEGTYQDFRGIMLMFPFVQQNYASAESGLTTFTDLDGKTVNLSTAGSSSDTWSRRIIELAGINVNITNLAPSDANQQMGDGLVDACVVNGLAPHSAVSEYSATKSTSLIGIDDELYEKIVAEYPYAQRYTIPAGTFDWQTEDVPTISTQTYIIVNKDMDEDLVYEITKQLYEHYDDLCEQHNAFTYMKAEDIVNATTPLHKGAARYYEEIGIEIPDAIKPID